jgi:hypothetical protein
MASRKANGFESRPENSGSLAILVASELLRRMPVELQGCGFESHQPPQTGL